MIPDPETTQLFNHLWDTRLARIDQQLERIANTAYWLGRKLAKHEITKEDVNRRLDGLCQCHADDPDWVPWHLARPAANDGLRRGMTS